MKKTSFLLPVVLVLPLAFAVADVKLPAIISDHMVLEKSASVPIWGQADPGEEVTVQMGTQTVKATAGADGKWRVVLDLASSGPGPFALTVSGKNQIRISDVVVGEVWVASGQSNMEWVLANTTDAAKEIAASANPLLRQFVVNRVASPTPLEATEGRWVASSPETSGVFTAVGYYFGKALQKELQAPVGLINTSWGGTPSEAWTSGPAIDSVPDLKAAKERILALPKALQQWREDFGAWLKQTNRGDRIPDAALAAPGLSSDGWQKVAVPGVIAAGDMTGNGAVWVRTEVDWTTPVTDVLPLDLGNIEGFDRVFWNGEELAAITPLDFPGTGFVRRGGPYGVPAGKVKPGKNTLAVRIHAPAGPARFAGQVRIGGKAHAGEWLAKQEFALPPLGDDQLAAVPKAPAAPPRPEHAATQLFNGMIAPIVPYAISGVIWYQGESNAGRAWQYRTAFPLLISDWRKAWGQGDFPFYFCQLANYKPKKSDPGESAWAELREAQASALSLPRTGQAVLIDLGESGDIHPRNKKDVGERLSRIALAKDHGKAIAFSGPVYDSCKIEGGRIRVSFQHADGGLVAKPVPAVYDVVSKENKTEPVVRNSPQSELEGFAICGADKVWVWADAKIDGESVLVWSDKVPAPVAVRYAWADNPTVNLCNAAGLPAAPFRTDDFPASTRDVKYP